MNIIANIISIINNKLWIFIAIIIFISGIYFTIKLKLIQFNFKRIIKEFQNKTLMLSLAGKIGVGSIAGISLAIYHGGPGTIFWIWIISLVSAPLSYSETYLAILYKETNELGGPAYYIKKGLNNYYLGALYSLIIIICYGFGFMSIQSNTITTSISNITNISKNGIAIILSIISFLIVFKGIKSIANTTNKIVPIMSVIYITSAILVTIKNITIIPNILATIIKKAFNFKSFISGFLPTILTGIERGIFSNEAGIGTGSIAASSIGTTNPIKEGYIQILSNYITSFLICTSTAIIVLTSNYQTLKLSDPNGIEIATYAFTYHFKEFGTLLLVGAIFLFAFSTILTGYCYTEQSLKYFLNNKKSYLTTLKIIISLIIFCGAIISPSFIWSFTDLFIAILIVINIYAMIKLRKKIKR